MLLPRSSVPFSRTRKVVKTLLTRLLAGLRTSSKTLTDEDYRRCGFIYDIIVTIRGFASKLRHLRRYVERGTGGQYVLPLTSNESAGKHVEALTKSMNARTTLHTAGVPTTSLGYTHVIARHWRGAVRIILA